MSLRYYEHEGITIYHADVLSWCASYKGDKFHALLCDPPYHLYSPVSKRPAGEWDGTRKDPFQRVKGGGFMGKDWDGGDIAFRSETWAALAEHLHDGAFIMAFASSRGWHRQAVAMEDAGLIMHPSIFGWGFGSGFPKATRIDHAVEAQTNLGRTNPQALRQIRMGEDYKPTGQVDYRKGRAFSSEIENDTHNPKLSLLAKAWVGHRYGLQALKPAVEPILVFQKKYKGKPVECITRTGAGALNIDGGRISYQNEAIPDTEHWKRTSGGWKNTSTAGVIPGDNSRGRWPANLVLTHISLPVMRLTGNLPYGIIEAIGRFYDGYTYLSELRQGNNDHVVQTECGAEVLQSGMQGRFSEDSTDPEADNNELPAMREGIYCTRSVVEGGSAEVLQSSLPLPLSENNRGGKSCDVWKASQQRSQGQDFPNTGGQGAGAKDGETPQLEGWADGSRRLRAGDDCNIVPRATGDGPSDAAQRNLYSGASAGDGDELRQAPASDGTCPPHQREQGRQSAEELDGEGQNGSFAKTSRDSEADRPIRSGEQTLEVLACDIPPQWIGYFEFTGEDLGCKRIGEKKVGKGEPKQSFHKASPNICMSGDNLGHTTRANLGTETIAEWECPEYCPVRRLGEQSGEIKSGNGKANTYEKSGGQWGKGIQIRNADYGDSGTAARFFFQADYELENTDPILYCAKASRSERDAGLEGFEERRVPRGSSNNLRQWERGERTFEELDEKSKAFATKARNAHPTVKPIKLTQHLATLLLPPEEYAPRRILVPFAGVGSEMIGAMLAGWEEIVGIELNQEYVDIAEARLDYWQTRQLELL